MEVEFTQYLMPNGRQVKVTININDNLAEQVSLIRAAGVRLTTEVLRTGQVSFAIEHSEGGDFDSELVANGPDVPIAVDRLIRRFDSISFGKWLRVVNS